MGLLKLLPLFAAALIIALSLFFFLPNRKKLALEQMKSLTLIEKGSLIEKLEPQYLVKYGNKSAPINIVEFFSFHCPHCIKLFREDFARIKEEFIDTGKVSLEFHPVPNDLLTVQAMICFEHLNEEEKRLFLEVILEEGDPSDSDLMAKLMMTAMNVFKKPLPYLNDQSYLNVHKVFVKSHDFILQNKINAVPTVEVNGRLFASEIPDYRFIKMFVKD